MKNKKNILLTLLIISVLFIFVACSKANNEMSIKWLSVNDIVDFDQEGRYDIYSIQSDEKLGTSIMQIAESENQDELIFNSNEDMKTADKEGNAVIIKQTMQVTVNKNTFEPKCSVVDIIQNNLNYKVIANYDLTESKKVYLEAQTPNGKQEINRDIKLPLTDNAQLLQTIRFLPLEVGYEVLINNMVSNSATLVPCKIVVKDKETLSVNDQERECYLVELRFVGEVQKSWYTVDNHQLIKYSNKGVYMVLSK